MSLLYDKNAVPPRKVIIKNEKLEPLEHEMAGPYQEGSDVRLTCEAKGGKCSTNLLYLINSEEL